MTVKEIQANPELESHFRTYITSIARVRMAEGMGINPPMLDQIKKDGEEAYWAIQNILVSTMDTGEVLQAFETGRENYGIYMQQEILQS